MKKKQAASRYARESGSTLMELMVATVVLLVGVVALAQLVPAAASLNNNNRLDSSGVVYAQQKIEQFIEQPLSSFGPFQDAQGCTWTLGTNATSLQGSPVVVVNNRTLIDFSKAQVANYSCNYNDPEDPTKATYDIRMAVATTVNAGGAATSKRFLVAVRRIGGDGPIIPTTLDAMVSK